MKNNVRAYLHEKRTPVIALSGFVVGTCVGMLIISYLVPDVVKSIVQYKAEEKMQRQLKTGNVALPEDVRFSQVKNFKVESDHMFILDLIHMNEMLILMNNRLQLDTQNSSLELKEFSNKAAAERVKEIEILRKIEERVTK